MFRSGLIIGYIPHSSASSSFVAKINLLPVLPYAELSYPLAFGLSPLVRLGIGGSFTFLKDSSGSPDPANESSFDAAVSISAGASYQHRSIPRVEFLLNLGYLVMFEQVNGSFINLSIGAYYQFFK